MNGNMHVESQAKFQQDVCEPSTHEEPKYRDVRDDDMITSPSPSMPYWSLTHSGYLLESQENSIALVDAEEDIPTPKGSATGHILHLGGQKKRNPPKRCP